MVNYYFKSVRDEQLKKIDRFKTGSWIYVEDPDKKELSQLAKKLSLEAGHLTDSTDPYEVPRLEIEKEAVYIFTRIPFSLENKIEKITTVPLLVIISNNFIMTICQKPLYFIDKFLEGNIDFSTTQKTKLFLLIFSQINSSYNRNLTRIIRQVRTISIHLENIKNHDIVQFVMFEAVLNDFLSALNPTNNILKQLLSGKILKLYENDKDLTEDLFLSNNQLIERSQMNLNIISNIRNAYSTIMTNNLNRVIKFLTALTIILNVPMIISSFYGMNVSLPLAGSPLAFWQISSFTLIITLILLLIFSKNRWL